MSNPSESQGEPKRLFVVHQPAINQSVWNSPNGIGELEIFSGFRMLIDRRQGPIKLAASIPEELLLRAGVPTHESSDINLRDEREEFPEPRIVPVLDAAMPRLEAVVHTAEDMHDAFLGASVLAKEVDPETYRPYGRHVVEVADYVRDSVWENREFLMELISNCNKNLEDFAVGVAFTVHEAVES